MKHVPKTLIILTMCGLFPALIILFFLRLEGGNMAIFGQVVEDYSLARLLATLLSILSPVLLLVPVAFTMKEEHREQTPWATVAGAPFLLLFPSVLAGQIVGGQGFLACFTAVLLMSTLLISLLLWLRLLGRWFEPRSLILIYGLVWAGSDYIEHLRLYVLPYLEAKFLAPLAHAYWLLPQVKSGPHHVDDYLQTLQFQLNPFLPTLIQIPLLGVVLFLLVRRSKPKAA